MTLRFTKSRHADRPHTLTCLRDDGTSTGQGSTEFFILHDLTHYATESTLGLTEAFYGLLNQGWDISSFEEREPGSRKSRRLPEEAMVAEVLAGTYDMENVAGPQPDEDRVERLTSVGLTRIPTPDEFQSIRSLRTELHQRWRSLAAGETLELPFPG